MTAVPYLVTSQPQSCGEYLSVALIGPDEKHRAEALGALGECHGADVYQFSSYPDEFEDLPRLLAEQHDVVVIDLDSNPDYALSLVERVCTDGNATVMVYSIQTNPDLIVRCMRAGAREFLPLPLTPGTMEGAMLRAAERRPGGAARTAKTGKLLVFMGAKGGVGVTSVACNFAVALAQNAREKTVLIDLDLPLGDAALNLGIASEFSTVDAMKAGDRLDGAFLNKLLVKHNSGLWVLASPGRFPHYELTAECIDRLMTVARREFHNVVVDVGSRLDTLGTTLHRDATAVYLVTQTGIPELRNANRLISQVFAEGGPKLEIVINRYQSKNMGVDDEHVTKALTRPAQWKIPNDHMLVRKMQVNATPLVLSDNSLSRTIRQMADSVNRKQEEPVKKSRFSFFGSKQPPKDEK